MRDWTRVLLFVWLGLLGLLLAMLLLSGCTLTPGTPIWTPSVTETVAATQPIVEVTATVSPTASPTTSATAAPEAGLVNGDFTGGYYELPDIPGGVPVGWIPWAVDNAFPEYGPETHPQHVLSGDDTAWKIHANWQMFEAGLFQRIDNLRAGEYYEAACPMFAYAGQYGGQGYPSEGDIYMKVGVDAAGGIDPSGAGVLWTDERANMIGDIANRPGDAYTAEELYQPYVVTFQAAGDTATLFVYARTQYAFTTNTAFVDNCTLARVDLVTPTPIVPPDGTATPEPTSEPEPTATPEPTAQPTVEAGCVPGAAVSGTEWRYLVVTDTLRVRYYPTIEPASDTGTRLHRGQVVQALCSWSSSGNTRWIKYEQGWFAAIYEGVVYAEPQ